MQGMQKAGNPLSKWRILIIVLIIIAIIVADQLTKAKIASYPYGAEIASLGFLRIIHIQNTGSAFGLFQGQVLPLRVVACVGVTALLFVAVWVYRKYSSLFTKWNMVAYGLIISGAIGNLIDRIRFGYVTDFVYTSFWPTFNVADSALTTGEIMVAIALLRYILAERKQTPPGLTSPPL
jgi:signal peptidase II